MPKPSPVTEADIKRIVAESEDFHAKIYDLQKRAERMGLLLDVGNMEDVQAFLRLSRVAQDLAYSIVLGVKNTQAQAALEAELRQAMSERKGA